MLNNQEMERFSSIEEKLHGLVPPALSEDGQRRLEDAVDSLAGVERRSHLPEVSPSARSSFWSRMAAVAAVVTMMAVPLTAFLFNARDSADLPSLKVGAEVARGGGTPQEMLLLKSTKLIDGQVDDGLIVSGDGSVPHYQYRYRVVDEEQVRDVGSGMVITIRQPRQEVVTIPLAQF